MPLIAKASNTVRNKNLIIVAMCLVFTVWFSYDGFIRYPQTDDQAVDQLKSAFQPGGESKLEALQKVAGDPQIMDTWQKAINNWPGWNKASPADRDLMDNIVLHAQNIREFRLGDWKTSFSHIGVQRDIVYGLLATLAASLWWFFHCQKRRAIADEESVSPAPGVVIPWDKITIVDNTRWKKSGIVEITYLDTNGAPQKAKFDDYELDREPLLEILDKLAEKADKAEFIPKEDPAPPAPPTTPAPPAPEAAPPSA